MNLSDVNNELIRTKNEISIYNQKIKQFPEGRIDFTHNGKYIKWFHVYKKKRKYIRKKEKAFASKLVSKAYFNALLLDLQQKQKALKAFQKSYSNYTSKVEIFLNNSLYSEFDQFHFQSQKTELQEWMTTEYEKNQNYPEHLKFSSPSGNIVRSKSEVFIDQALYFNQIPYRYESILRLNDIVLYPDFTIRHPKTGEYYYWEHFGMMDQGNYAAKAFQKMQWYNASGIYLNKNLIITIETRDDSLSADKVEDIIQRYFI